MSQLIQIDPDLLMNEDRREELYAMIRSLTAKQQGGQGAPKQPEPFEEYRILTCNSPSLEELEQEWAGKPRFCKTCMPLSRDLVLFSFPRTTTPVESKEFITWRFDFADLIEAAAGGCQFCGFLCVQFFAAANIRAWGMGITQNKLGVCCSRFDESPSEDNTAEGQGASPGEAVSKALVRLRKLNEEHPGTWFEMQVQPTDYDVQSQKYGKLKLKLSKSNLSRLPEEEQQKVVSSFLATRREIVLELFAAKDDPAARYLKYQPVDTRPESKSSFAHVRGWIDDCIAGHDSCRKPDPTLFPTRVIEILDESGNNLRIATITASSTDDDDAQQPNGVGANSFYAALSYCWGGPQLFATTSDTLVALQSGFKAADLPQTLQDAVKTTRSLGLRYLWVDALCILQDSESDKHAELARMASYYKNSFVTIAAHGSKCTDSFLSPRGTCDRHPDSDIPRDVIQLKYLCKDGQDGIILFREEMPYRMSEEPISQRGWTFQERVLSSRMVFYGAGRTIWQCHSTQSSLGGFEDWDNDFRSIGNRKMQLDLMSSETLDEKTAAAETKTNAKLSPQQQSILDVWYRAVQEYSYRSLTMPQDKLPAISALAAEVASLNWFSPDTYHAGLWRSDFLRGLLWSTHPTMVLKRPPNGSWRAPSWSWASVDNVVTYSKLPPPHAKPVAKIEKSATPPLSSVAPFGEILQEGTELVLRIPVIRGMDPENLETIVRVEMRMKRSTPFTALWWEETNDLTARGISEDAGGIGWKAPADCVLGVLFVTVDEEKDEKQSGDTSDGQGSSQDVPDSADKAGPPDEQEQAEDNQEQASDGQTAAPTVTEEKAKDHTAQPEEIEKESPVASDNRESKDEPSTPAKDTNDNPEDRQPAADASGQEEGGAKEQDGEPRKKSTITFTGLILAPVGEDKYERLGTFSVALPGGQLLSVPLEILTIV